MFGLRGSGPHISRIERSRGSLATMGKARLVVVWRRAAMGAGLVAGDENRANRRKRSSGPEEFEARLAASTLL
jgi:hypothetical protein